MNQINLVSIGDITPYINNPRKNDDAVKKVADSIKQFGWHQPIVVDSNNIIIAGHTRYKAAKKLKLKEVPVVVAEELTPEQIKAYRIADNRVAQESEWDNDLLKIEFEGLHDLEFDLSHTGFDEREINKILGFELIEDAAIEVDQPSQDNKFKVTVECEDEADQDAVCRLLTAKGYRCKAS